MNLKNNAKIKEILRKQEEINYRKMFINFIKFYKIKNKLDEKDPPKLNLSINLKRDDFFKVKILNCNLANLFDIKN